MRVILTHNVPKLGEVGDVCNVAAGYGRNFLIPQGLAILATPGALHQIDGLKRAEQRRQDKVRFEMTAVAKRISSLRLPFTAKVGETGRLYGSITAQDIANAIEEQIGEPVDRRKILLDESIRTLGEHVVPIHLMPGVDASPTVIVEADAEILEDIGLTEDLDEEEADGGEATGVPVTEWADPESLADDEYDEYDEYDEDDV